MTRNYTPGVYEPLIIGLWEKQKTACGYGEKCIVGKPLVDPRQRSSVPWRERPTVHHILGNGKDDRYAGALLHHACNTAAYKELVNIAVTRELLRRYGIDPDKGPQTEPTGQAGERESSASIPIQDTPLRELQDKLPGYRLVPIRQGDSYSNRKNREIMGPYFMRVYRLMRECQEEGKWLPFDEVNNFATMKVGGVPQTTARYLQMMCAIDGPMMETEKTKGNISVVTYRKKEYAFLEPHELYSLFPPEGADNVDEEMRASLIKKATDAFMARENAEIEKRFGKIVAADTK